MRIIVLALTTSLLLAACRGPEAPEASPEPRLYEGRTAAEWAALLSADDAVDSTDFLAANEALVALGGDSVPHLVELLGHESEAVRFTAATALSRIGGPVIAPAAPALVPLLRSDVAHLRIAALRAVEAMGPEADALEPEVVMLLQDEDWTVREQAALAAGPLARKDGELEKRLETLSREDRHGRVRHAARRALGEWDAQLPPDREDG